MLTNVTRPLQIAVGTITPAATITRSWCRNFSLFGSLAARRHLIHEGRETQQEDEDPMPLRSPFYFETAYSIFAKRPTRPFPPPFVSRPSGSFSDPLTTHNRVKYRQARVDGQLLRGITNGDDAILIGHHNFLAVNDGVGAWAQKERGHAALWSRLIAHYWALECETALQNAATNEPLASLKPIEWLQTAFEKTQTATKNAESSDILGTTTATSALLHHKSETEPVVLATQLGDCEVLIVRPSDGQILYKTTEQWHWFDCPRQLGTNSPDNPTEIAITDTVDVQIDDIVLVMSDGVTDNLWEHEIAAKACETFKKWKDGDPEAKDGVMYMARELMNAAKVVALDPYAESPYMERALDEGIAAEGGKLDDISVVVGICQKR